MNRKEQRQQWLSDYFKGTDFKVTTASADASFRSYFRITTQSATYILMDAPPQHEDCRPFVAVSELLLTHQVHVPKIYAKDLTAGFLLLADFGNRLYLHELNDQTIDQLYTPAINSILKMQEITDGKKLPPYSRTLLLNEMALFKDWYINKHLGLELTDSQELILNNVFVMLAESALEQPQVMVHRDYHSRNLMITTDSESPGIIDFQDAVCGPFTYDLASLLKDCYINWPEEVVNHYSHYFLSQYKQQFNTQIEVDQFNQWFDLMAVQRHLKAIGIFCRLNYRDGKQGFLNDIPRTMNYIHATARKYPTLNLLETLLKEIQPTLTKLK